MERQDEAKIKRRIADIKTKVSDLFFHEEALALARENGKIEGDELTKRVKARWKEMRESKTMYRKKTVKASRYFGVTWNKSIQKYVAQIWLPCFKTTTAVWRSESEKECAQAYDMAVRVILGPKERKLNFSEQGDVTNGNLRERSN